MMSRWIAVAALGLVAACSTDDAAAPPPSSTAAPTESTSVAERPVKDNATVTAGTAVLPTTPQGGTMMAAIVRGVVEHTGD
ncbi:MAG: hypothetical protein AAFY28_21645, partial [Actinomycetota bacterium]